MLFYLIVSYLPTISTPGGGAHLLGLLSV